MFSFSFRACFSAITWLLWKKDWCLGLRNGDAVLVLGMVPSHVCPEKNRIQERLVGVKPESINRRIADGDKKITPRFS